MKFTALATACAVLPTTFAWKGMENTLADILSKREGLASAQADCRESTELIGDLEYLVDEQLTPVGARVRNILRGDESGESDEIYYHNMKVPPLRSYACAQDTCCVWYYIANDMEKLFRGPSGRCTNAARGAIRLGFHDAAGWSKHTGPGGGADGSIALTTEELTRPLNHGLEEIVKQAREWYHQWAPYGVSMADIIQMAGTVATVVCPLGPRIRSFVGRRDSHSPCSDGLLPDVNSDSNTLIELFRAKTIQPHGLAALIGAHSASQQRFVDPSRFGDPQDSTPGVWDTLFYKQTLGRAPPRVFKFRSDIVLAEDPRIYPEFLAFAGPGGQEHWNADYAREYVRLSLLGVYNINNLTDCTGVLPAARRRWQGAHDQWAVDLWVNTTVNVPEVAETLRKGELISNMVSLFEPDSSVEKVKRAFS